MLHRRRSLSTGSGDAGGGTRTPTRSTMLRSTALGAGLRGLGHAGDTDVVRRVDGSFVLRVSSSPKSAPTHARFQTGGTVTRPVSGAIGGLCQASWRARRWRSLRALQIARYARRRLGTASRRHWGPAGSPNRRNAGGSGGRTVLEAFGRALVLDRAVRKAWRRAAEPGSRGDVDVLARGIAENMTPRADTRRRARRSVRRERGGSCDGRSRGRS